MYSRDGRVTSKCPRNKTQLTMGNPIDHAPIAKKFTLTSYSVYYTMAVSLSLSRSLPPSFAFSSSWSNCLSPSARTKLSSSPLCGMDPQLQTNDEVIRAFDLPSSPGFKVLPWCSSSHDSPELCICTRARRQAPAPRSQAVDTDT